jgi:hypothetical protein
VAGSFVTQAARWLRATPGNGTADTRPPQGADALSALKHGNATHNQEIALCLLDDYRRNPPGELERLLLACAQHTAGHQKYGDTLEPYRRYMEALGFE